jgi:Flp pilus assembly protein TadG
MLLRTKVQRRFGTTVVQCAVVYPAVFLLILGLVVGSLGVFRFQEVANLARSAARYASTHGAQYRKDAGESIGSPGTYSSTSGGYLWYSVNPSAASGSDTSWAGDVYDQAVRPNLVILNPSNLQVQVGWPSVVNLPGTPDNWPGSTVSVTVTYQWFPEILIFGPINLTSTSTLPITN